jgi:hypothetical protein
MPSEAAEIQGRCAPAFEPLRRALADIIDTGCEVGAALAVYVGKQAVVDLWAGHKDSARTRPWDAHTIVNLYSMGKAVQARPAGGGTRRTAQVSLDRALSESQDRMPVAFRRRVGHERVARPGIE